MRPNILHLFTDQQRFDTISALGNPHIHTPNFDRLVHEGTAFTRAYSPSPECVPARASMITGWYPPRTNCYCNEQAMPTEDTPTYMHHLSSNGYNAVGIGKCHFTKDPQALRGFQKRFSQEEIVEDRDADDYARWLIEEGYDWVLEPHGVRGEMYYVPQVSVLPERVHPVTWVANRTIQYIESQGKAEEPWYAFCSFVHPHPPFAPPIPWHKSYRAPNMPLPDMPENLDDLLCFVNRFQNRYKYRDRGIDLNLVRCIRAYYYACVSFIDRQLGRIFNALEESGQWDDTLIMLSSDHGEYLGDYGCFGKRGMHEASARVPMLVRWPGGEYAGRICREVTSLVDLAPTILEAAEVPFSPEDFDGCSLRNVVAGKANREYVYSQYNRAENGLYLIASKNWKYIFSAPDQREYLFDCLNDPCEHHNLAQSPSHRETLLRLRKDCLNWLHEVGEDEATDGSGTWRQYPMRSMPSEPDRGLIYQDPPWWQGALSSPS